MGTAFKKLFATSDIGFNTSSLKYGSQSILCVYETSMRMSGDDDDDNGEWNESATSSGSHDMQNYTHSVLLSTFKIRYTFVRVKFRANCAVALWMTFHIFQSPRPLPLKNDYTQLLLCQRKLHSAKCQRRWSGWKDLVYCFFFAQLHLLPQLSVKRWSIWRCKPNIKKRCSIQIATGFVLNRWIPSIATSVSR